MEKRAYELRHSANREVSIQVIPGHFATKHSHVSHCVNMTQVKSDLTAAKAAAKLFAERFIGTPVDTIISLDRMKMVGAFLADDLSQAGINIRQNIAVISPEIAEDKMLLRDNFLPYVKGKRVLLLMASVTTGETAKSVVEGIRYYGGEAVGVACVFGVETECEAPVVRLFGLHEVPDYQSYSPVTCPLCKSGVKVDAVVNSYGYSKIV